MPGTDVERHPESAGQFSRAQFLRGLGIGVTALAVPSLAVACGRDDDEAPGPAPQAAETSAQPTPTQPVEGEPKTGGRLRVAFVGGGTSETLNPNGTVAVIDAARSYNLFDQLVRVEADGSLGLEQAESFEPNANGDVWTIRIKEGLTWHDGAPITADDVLYSFDYIATSEQTFVSKDTALLVDRPGMGKLDERTVEVPLMQPNAEFPAFFVFFNVVKDGSTDADFERPIGSGPFMFESCTPGQESLFVRNPNHWREGQPYVDELQMISLPDSAARLNALIGGQVDAVEALDFAQARAQMNSGEIAILNASGSSMVPLYVATDIGPFDDVRVRQALRLLADRQALVDVAQLGFGEIGNDLFGKGLPFYNDQLPQREYDPEQARALLRGAGQEGLSVTLKASTAAPGMIESATAFVEQAAAGGVTINLQREPADSYYGEKYLTYDFAQTNWFSESIIGHMSKSLARPPEGTETHWNNSAWRQAYEAILATVDEDQRSQHYFDAQEILWNEGGYIIWGFYPLLDGLATNVRGAVPNAAQPIARFDFETFWLA